jgi:hypothetical protein
MKQTYLSPQTLNVSFQNVDANMLEVVNALFRLAYPLFSLIGLAIGNEPTDPQVGDTYLVTENGTVWGVEVEKDHLLKYGALGWEVLPLKLPDLAQGLTASTVASAVDFTPVGNITAANVQTALAEVDSNLTTALGDIETILISI